MANQITDNRTAICVAQTSAPASETWDAASSATEDTEIFIEGTTSIGEQITNGRRYIAYDDGAARDWSDSHFYIWINCGIVGLLETKANGGFRIRFAGNDADADTNYFEVNVGGSDDWPEAVAGGWVMFVVDIEAASASPDATGGTPPATTAIRYVGYSAITAGTMTRTTDNTWIDAIWRLPDATPGIIVEGRNGGTTDWDSGDIFTQLGESAGMFLPTAGGAWKINAPIQFGINDTTTHGFTDTNAIWLWDDQEFAATDLYSISALGNSGGTTNVTFGAKTGSGDTASGAQGLTIAAASGGVRWAMDFDDPDLDSIGFYGCSFQHGGTFQLDDAAVEVISTLYIDCTQAVVGQNSLQLKNSVIQPANGDGVAFMVTDDFLDIRFCNFEFLDGHAIEITSNTVSPQENRGNQFIGSFSTTPGSTDAAIYNDSGGALTIDNTNSSNLNTDSYRNGASATTTIQNSVSVTITVQDADGNPIEGAAVYLEEDPGGTVIISYDLTDVNGEVTTTFSGSTPQNVTGVARKGTKSPVYKPSNINDTIGGSGLAATITLVADE